MGLGNPGPEYSNTRHNLGFRVLDYFAWRHNLEFREKKRLYWAARGQVGSHPVVLAKPRTFMNLSGQAVLSLCTTYGFSPSQIIVLSDDFCLPLGRLRLRKSGGSGGHNGLNNIIATLGSANFIRLRLGVGPTPSGLDPVDFVLGRFAPSDEPTLKALEERANEALSYLLEAGVEAAMNKFNGAPSPAPEPESKGEVEKSEPRLDRGE